MMTRILPLLLALLPAAPDRPDPRLAEPFVDGTFGFRLRPPVDWALNRERSANTAGLTVLRITRQVDKATVVEIAVRIKQLERAMPIEAALKDLSAGLT